MGIYRRSKTTLPLSERSILWSGRAIGTLLLAVGIASFGSVGLSSVRAAADSNVAVVSPYQRAVESFKQHDYEHALSLLEEVQDPADPKAAADVANLRGAIYLHLRRYTQAEEAFTKANKLDPHLWEAQFNAAEISFRRKDYTGSAKQFQELLDRTSRFGHEDERELIQYKAMLSALLAGHEQAVDGYIQEHAKDSRPPLAYYYLHAALENRHERSTKASPWLAEARGIYAPPESGLYAESFREMGWEVPRAGTMLAGVPAAARTASGLGLTASTAKPSEPTTVAVVQLIGRNSEAAGTIKKRRTDATPSTADKPEFRIGSPGEVPAGEEAASAVPLEDTVVASGPVSGLIALAKPPTGTRKSHASTPLPTATPSSTPGASAAPSASPSASASPESDLPANASPAASPEPGFIQAYEAAYVQFLQEKYDEARELLDKADSIQAGQPSSASLRNQIFKHFYGEAYLRYASKDYDGAIKQLDSADKALPNQADANNMRGLIFSRQKNYPAAEEMFKKSIAQDPTFWEAKFNLAELPFIYKNYTEARGRFEELFSHTDPAKQPKEAELTEFKVFLTLLLEGKEPAARAFMERFNFSGSTPARYYCQAALDFYHGDTDKALGWISSAKKEYPAKLEGIFAQSFFRVGWLTDANAAALAAATPSTEPLLAATRGVAGPSPGESTPTEMAMASPSKSPDIAAVSATPASSPATSGRTAAAATTAAPALATANPSASPATSKTAIAAASASPAPSTANPSVSPATNKVAVAAATASPALTVVNPSASPATSKTAPAASKATPLPTTAGSPAVASSGTPAKSPSRDLLKIPAPSDALVSPSPSARLAQAASPARPSQTPVPEPAVTVPSPAVANKDDEFSGSDLAVLVFLGFVFAQTLFTVIFVLRAIKNKKARLAKKPLRYSGQTAVKPQEAPIP